VWKTLYPLPYEAALRSEALRNDFDPMFAAGLIRQESTFQADIVSYANAIGLMQVLPKTGKILAKQLKIRYSKNLLYDANYNLQLGMLYIANLVRLTGAPEYAAAAYNAGEDRIALWNRNAITKKSPNWWNPSPSPKRANTCKSSCAMPLSTGSFMALVGRNLSRP